MPKAVYFAELVFEYLLSCFGLLFAEAVSRKTWWGGCNSDCALEQFGLVDFQVEGCFDAANKSSF